MIISQSSSLHYPSTGSSPSTRGVYPRSGSFNDPACLIAPTQLLSKRPRNVRVDYGFRPPPSHHEEKLHLLLDETKWRDELTSLHISSIESKDRHQLVDVIVRLLYGLMLEKKGRSRGDHELSLLADLMLNPTESGSAARQDGPFSLHQVSSNVSFKQQDRLPDFVRLITYWPALLGTTLDLVVNAQTLLSSMTADDAAEKVENEADEEESEIGEVLNSRVLRSVGQQSLKRLADFFRCPVEFDFTPYISPSFSAIFTPRLELLDQENIQAPSALLELFYVWTSRPEFAIHLVQHPHTP
ncbi:hypothetical protein M405DRAFT_920958 [Rhizopogon salebrosus TDB-379]|nr:hypothetical protein M405DRAFT_920958 [Rhizopogon salebrosus TDB-379]